MIEFYECGALNTQVLVTLYMLLRNDKTDTLIPTPGGFTKEPSHYIVLAIGLVPRIYQFGMFVYYSSTG